MRIPGSLLATAAALWATSALGDAKDGAKLLFKNGAHGLSEVEQVKIFDAADLKLSDDGKSFVDGSCGQPAEAAVTFLDLNGDGVEEVLVQAGNSCTSGMTGTSATLFIKIDGRYQTQLGFPGIVEPLKTKHKGYADLQIGGPGFCFPVWVWDGKAYVHDRNEPQEPGGCKDR